MEKGKTVNQKSTPRLSRAFLWFVLALITLLIGIVTIRIALMPLGIESPRKKYSIG